MPRHFATVCPVMLLLFLAGLMPLHAEAMDGGAMLSYEAHLDDQRLNPRVGGEERILDLSSASIHLRERLRGGFHGGLMGGLPSLRWTSADGNQRSRLGGHLAGVSLGGRHPATGKLAMVWEGSYTWIEAGGRVDGEEVDISLRETAVRAGVAWWPGDIGLTLGLARQSLEGEQQRSNGTQGSNLAIEWRPDLHPYVVLGLKLEGDGWMGIHYSAREPRGSLRLVFGRGF